MLLCQNNTFQCADCPLPPFLSVFSPALAFVCLLQIEKIAFPLASNGRCCSSFFLDLHQTTKSFYWPLFFDHCSKPNKPSHSTTVCPSSSPKNFRSPCPADSKNGGADIIASPSSLLALLIFCSARSIDHVGDLSHYASAMLRMRLRTLFCLPPAEATENCQRSPNKAPKGCPAPDPKTPLSTLGRACRQSVVLGVNVAAGAWVRCRSLN